jgi:hypothetical protein
MTWLRHPLELTFSSLSSAPGAADSQQQGEAQMVSNNMIRLEATAHQAELHRAAAGAHREGQHRNGASLTSHRLQRVVARMLQRTTARRAQGTTAIPRVSI